VASSHVVSVTPATLVVPLGRGQPAGPDRAITRAAPPP
jgi:hypothetical protein